MLYIHNHNNHNAKKKKNLYAKKKARLLQCVHEFFKANNSKKRYLKIKINNLSVKTINTYKKII